MLFKKNKKTVVQAISEEPYAVITGKGTWGYMVVIRRNYMYTDPYYGDTQERSKVYYSRHFKFGRRRAERYAKTRLDRAKQKYDHARFSKTITLK